MFDKTKFKGYLPEYPFKPGSQIEKIDDIFFISKKASDQDIFGLGRIREPLTDEEIKTLKNAFETLYVAGIKHKLSLIYSEDLCKWTWADLLGAAQAMIDKKQGEADYLYISIDCSKRMLTVGEKSYVITSENEWDFIRKLIADMNSDEITPRFDGGIDYKNYVDSLRRRIGAENLRQVVTGNRDGYRMNPRVKVLNSGQIGIRRSK